ncbi:MAG: exodeoxyribonuclease VII large subunit [Spirochaetes bacterium]|nr:exodeoxyribonuclease VII large subunit [Spirochaetota bacterium]
MNHQNYLTVSALTDQIKSVLENNFQRVFIQGEISNFRPSSTNIWYFSLIDEQASIKGIVFRNQQLGILNQLQKFGIKKLQNGQKILVEGKLNLYKKGGDYSIVIDKIIPQGIGDLFANFELLKKKLAQQGLFEPAIKKELPQFPEHIGVITSPTGAALQDILNVLKRRNSNINITVFPAAVQGADAKKDIVKAIKYANIYSKQKKLDVLILARGGGSIEDLWCFNEEEVAYAIYHSELPVLTGVGHEIDFTIADFCADLRAPTPSAAAEIVVKNNEELYNQIASYQLRIQGSFLARLDKYRLRYSNCQTDRLATLFNNFYQDKLQTLDYLTEKLNHNFLKKKKKYRHQFSLLTEKLNHLSPLNILKRGYSLVYTDDQKLIKRSEQVKIDDTIEIILSEGKITADVKKVK